MPLQYLDAMEPPPKTGIWSRSKVAIARHYHGTLIGRALRQSSPEEWKQIHSSAFDDAKKVSDFIGMIVRLGFAFLAYLFLSDAAEKAEFWYRGYVLGMSAVLALGLYAVMIFHVMNLVTIYFLSDTGHWKSPFQKITITLISFAMSLVAVYGVSELALAIAKSGSILPANR